MSSEQHVKQCVGPLDDKEQVVHYYYGKNYWL